MSSERYVLLGLGRSRSSWFGNVALWTTSGAVPAEFLKCLSAAHVRQHLTALQPHSALIVEEGIADVDRDLIESAKRAQVPTFVISTGNTDMWLELGATAVLPPDMTPALFLQVLATHARTIKSGQKPEETTIIERLTDRQGRLIAVCGAGGTGTSTVAIAIAQALASDVTETYHVLLADFARNSEQAMLHDSPDVSPGLEEIVELHRHRRPTTAEIRELTYGIEQRGYRLLLGQRRMGAWTSFSPSSVLSTLAGLRRTFRTVVADITADFEGEADSGSYDIEERNMLTRSTVAQADIVYVVGTIGFKGIHALARTMRQAVNAGAAEDRIVPVITNTPKNPLTRAEISKALPILGKNGTPAMKWNAPLFLPGHSVESALRDGTPLSKHLTKPFMTTTQAMYERLSPTSTLFETTTPTTITAGSLGIATFGDTADG